MSYTDFFIFFKSIFEPYITNYLLKKNIKKLYMQTSQNSDSQQQLKEERDYQHHKTIENIPENNDLHEKTKNYLVGSF